MPLPPIAGGIIIVNAIASLLVACRVGGATSSDGWRSVPTQRASRESVRRVDLLLLLLLLQMM